MAYLQNAEFSIVKLDGSLVRPILANERSENIVRSIQQLADSLGFCLLAEFVETPGTAGPAGPARVYPLPRVSVQPGPSAGRLYYVYPKMGVRPMRLPESPDLCFRSSDDGGCRELVRYPAGSGDDDCV